MEMKSGKFVHFSWALIVFGLFIFGTGLIFLATWPYEDVQAIVNLIPKDGKFESFTPEIYTNFSWIKWGGFGMVVVSLLAIGFREKSIRWHADQLQKLHHFGVGIKGDFKAVWFSLRPLFDDKWHLVGLGMIICVATLTNAQFLSRPMRYDEAYTYNIYASKPILQLIADYSLPNNHIFHSILVHISTALFGAQPWAVRLPAFIAGILIIPTGYLAAYTVFSADVALLAAGFCAFFSVLMDYATNARGYTLLCGLTLVIMGLGFFVKNNPNRLVWILIGTGAVLGFYTIPTMLYPFGAVGLWLLVVWIFRDYSKSYSPTEFFRNLVLLGGLTVAGVIFVYSPVILTSGFQILVGNNFVSALPWVEFIPKNIERLAQTWQIWHKGVSVGMMIILAVGFVLGLILEQKISRQRISFPIVMIVFAIIAVSAQRVAPFDRMWLFAVPVLLIWSAAGMFYVYKWFSSSLPQIPQWGLDVLKVGLFLGFCGGLLLPARAYHLERSIGEGFGLKVAHYILENVSPDDVVVTIFPHDAPIRYYLDLYNLNDFDYFDFDQNTMEKVIVVYNSNAGQPIPEILQKQKIPNDLLNFETPRLIDEFGQLDIIEIPRR